jgi:predicted nucleotidyltransferase
MTSLQRLREKRDEILSLAAKHGARNVRVFGSVARGEDRPESDVDLLVELASGHGLFDLVDLEDEIGALIQREVEVVTERAVSPFLREAILTQAVGL